MRTDGKKKKIVVFVAGSLLLALTAVAVVYAAYFGKGNFKDVFVNKRSFFSSDVLSSVSSFDDVPAAQVGSGGTEKLINLYNYDLSTGEYNDFDLSFSVYAWLGRSGTGTCRVTFGDTTAEVTASEPPVLIAEGVLAGGRISTCSIMVSFPADGTKLDDCPSVNIAVLPVLPKYMSAKMLGAQIIPALSDAFSVNGYFEDAASGYDIGEYAAFKFALSMLGEAPANGKLRLSWNSSALELVTDNRTLPDGVEVQTKESAEGFDRYIELDEASDSFYRMTFVRARNGDGTDNPWADTARPITWDTLKEYVTWEQTAAGE